MFRDLQRSRLFTRRVAILGTGNMLLLGLLAGRLYQLQVVESETYKRLAEANRISLRFIAPTRGRLLDRYGHPIADNRENYRAVLIAEQVPDVSGLLDSLSKVIPLKQEDKIRILKDIRRRQGFIPVMVRENLGWNEVSRLEVNSPDLPGLSIEVGHMRRYLHATNFCHVLGYVSSVSEKEVGSNPLLKVPGLKVGRSGAERAFDNSLRGKVGTREVEVTAAGRVIRELSRNEGAQGQDVRMTLDTGLQTLATNLLSRHRSASAAVVDVRSGEVLALASVPGFDPNELATGMSRPRWSNLSSDPLAPLLNKAIGGMYPPASTFKMIVALAALEAGRVTEADHVTCHGHLRLGNSRLHCWRRYGHGQMNIVSAIQQSCDVYFYDLARRIGADRIAEMAVRLGLGTPAGTGLPGEKRGNIPTRAWKERLFGGRWELGETMIMSIGQGFVLASPLQLAIMTARIANGRKAVSPRLDLPDASELDPLSRFRNLGIAESSLDLVRRGMHLATNSVAGTAYKARIFEANKEMAGKTGTSQIRRITRGEREAGVKKNEELPWAERDHALYVGFAPSHAPRYAVAVVVEHGGSGGEVAAPIARDLLLAAQNISQVPDGGRREEI